MAAGNGWNVYAMEGWTIDNLHEGITYDGEHATINANHPVMEYFSAAAVLMGEPELTERDLLRGRKYLASAADTRKCLASLVRKLGEIKDTS